MREGGSASGYGRLEDLPGVVPVFPLDGALLLPRGGLPLNIFEPRYLNMIDDVMAGDRLLGMVQTVPGGDRTHPRLSPVGCVGRVTTYSETEDGRYLISLTGVCRFMTGQEIAAATPYRQVRVDFAPFEDDLRPPSGELAFNRDRLLAALKAYLHSRDLDIEWETAHAAPAEALINSLAMALPFGPPEKQALLEAATLAERENTLVALLEIEAASNDDEDPPSLQ